MPVKAEDFETPNLLDDTAYERFNLFASVVENLQSTVGPEAALDLEDKDPAAEARALLEISVELSELDRAAKAFLLKSTQGKKILAAATDRILDSYFARIE